ncbi:MAG: type II toxin-antitoxin system VapC family toxin [Terriglobales bacterium]
MTPVYFDTSVFLAILKKEKTAQKIRELLQQLQAERVRIYTSIITVQECSVLGFRRGTVVRDNITRVGKIARVVGITPEIALTAAKLEAQLADNGNETEYSRAEKKRRKWDCFHIATAQVYKCGTLFAEDKPMQGREISLGLKDILIRPPRPLAKERGLFTATEEASAEAETTKAAAAKTPDSG